MISVIETSIGFTIFVSVFILSAGFWGRLILKGLKIPVPLGYGEPMVMVAFLATFSVVTRYAFIFTQRFEYYFIGIFIIGAIGFVFEFVLKAIKKRGENNKASYIYENIKKKHSIFFVFAALSLLFSLITSLSSPYGMLDPWVGGSLDYYSWIFVADAFRGDFDLSLYHLNNFDYFLMDCFGTNVFFALFSAAKGETSLMATSGFVIMLLSLIGTAVYRLIRDVMVLPRPISFLLTIGFAWCNYLLYLAENGNFSYLVALAGFLPLVKLLITFEPSETLIIKVKKLFFPVLFLFFVYNGGFVPLLGMAYLASIICCGEKAFDEKRLINSLWDVLKKSIVPLTLAVILTFLVVPQATYFMASRVVDVVQQQSGYSQGFLDPRLLLGFPILDESLRARVSHTSGVSWGVFLAVFLGIFLLCIKISRNKAVESKDISLNNIKVLFILYFFSLCLYLIAYFIFGDVYKVWKLMSYSALPFSFIPLALLFLIFKGIFKGKVLFYLSCFAAIIIVIFSHGPEAVKYAGTLKVFSGHRPLLPLMVKIYEALEMENDTKRIIFDFNHPNPTFAAAVLSEAEDIEKIIVNVLYFFPQDNNYIEFIEPDTVLYSDRDNPNLINGKKDIIPYIEKVYRYDYAAILEKGVINYDGILSIFFEPTEEVVGIKVLAPERLWGKDLELNVIFEVNNRDISCQKVLSHTKGEPEESYLELEISEITVPVAKELVKDGVFETWLMLPGFPNEYDPKTAEFKNECGIRLEEVTVSEVANDI